MPDPSPVTIERAVPRSIAGIAAFKDRAALRAAMQRVFGSATPTAPGWIQAGDVTLSCLAPARYLATASRDADLPGRLAESLAGLAAITDQSDMWEMFTVQGPGVRDVLARLVPVDLDPQRFPVGALACTRAGHLHVRLWRVGERVYEIAVMRSAAGDLLYQLEGRQDVLF
jgi:sarcosine oxidase subunit gamma